MIGKNNLVYLALLGALQIYQSDSVHALTATVELKTDEVLHELVTQKSEVFANQYGNELVRTHEDEEESEDEDDEESEDGSEDEDSESEDDDHIQDHQKLTTNIQSTAQVKSKATTQAKVATGTTATTSVGTGTVTQQTLHNWQQLQETDPENAACYQTRYTDLNGMDPTQHFQQIGEAQGRLWTCAKNMTMLEAEDYIWRYPDLQRAFGGAFGDYYYQMAAKHFKTSGHSENRNGLRGPDEEPWLCQDGSNTHLYDYHAECKCTSTLVIGLGVRPDNGQAITTFKDMREWQTDIYPINGTMDVTHMFKLKSGLFPNTQKRMYCERKNYFKYSQCGNEGDMCMCPAGSAVLFGNKATPGLHDNNEWTANYTINTVNFTDGGNITCNAANFEDVDPQPGVVKGCYCMDISANTDIWHDFIYNKKVYWREIRAAKEAAAAEAAAEAEATQAEALAEIKRKELEADTLAAETAQAEKEALAKQTYEAEKAAAVALAKQEKDAAIAVLQASLAAATQLEQELSAAKIKATNEAAEAERIHQEELNQMNITIRYELKIQYEQLQAQAVKDQTEAALALQKVENDKLIAQQKETDDLAKIARDEAHTELMAQEKQAASLANAGRNLAQRELETQHEEALAEAIAAEALRKKEQFDKELAAALEAQEAAYNKSMTELNTINKDADDAKAARDLEAKLARELKDQQALTARIAADAEAWRIRNETIAEENRVKLEEIAAKLEEKRLAEVAYNSTKELERIEEERLELARKEAKAQSDLDVQNAKAESERLDAEAKKAEEDRLTALEKKNKLIEDQENAAIKLAMHQNQSAAATARSVAANATAELWKQQALEEERLANLAITEANNKKAAHQAEIELERLARIATQNALLEKIRNDTENARIAGEHALAAATLESQRNSDLLASQQANALAARTDSFSDKYKHVWASGPPGIVWMQMTTASRKHAEEIIASLFYKNLIADVQDINHVYQRTFTKQGHLDTDADWHKLIMVTTEEMVPGCVEEIGHFYDPKGPYPMFDLTVTPVATGDKFYINWVKKQTKKIQDQNIAGGYNPLFTNLTTFVNSTYSANVTGSYNVSASMTSTAPVSNTTIGVI